MSTKHTPGPWMSAASKNHPDFYSIEKRDGDGRLADDICFLTLKKGEEGMANARLIAAAPDLLEALELLLHDRTPWTVQCAKEAIAKATGEQA